MVIAIELMIAFVLFKTGMNLLNVPEKNAERKSKTREEGIMESKLMKSLTDAVPVEEESAILLDHDYDGIRELDNNLPPWWKYGFYTTIVVAVIYLVHFHVLHTGKLSIEEYNQELKEGEQQVAEYKKTAMDIVDETTVTKLTDAASLSEGQTIFKANCTPCHGEFGEGKEGLGPNFTDDYWLHSGSIQSVFKSIKYGWTDKGMKSWQQDLKPNEIQLVASYVKSLRGTNPPNPKEKQGELYVEENEKPISDSTKSDSVKIPGAVDSLKK
jgi:cytochrome c oxidase cbb3-type subunit 3